MFFPSGSFIRFSQHAMPYTTTKNKNGLVLGRPAGWCVCVCVCVCVVRCANRGLHTHTNHPAIQPISKPTDRPTDRPSQPARQATKQTDSHPTNQTVNQSTKQTANQPCIQSFNQPIYHPLYIVNMLFWVSMRTPFYVGLHAPRQIPPLSGAARTAEGHRRVQESENACVHACVRASKSVSE